MSTMDQFRSKAIEGLFGSEFFEFDFIMVESSAIKESRQDGLVRILGYKVSLQACDRPPRYRDGCHIETFSLLDFIPSDIDITMRIRSSICAVEVKVDLRVAPDKFGMMSEIVRFSRSQIDKTT